MTQRIDLEGRTAPLVAGVGLLVVAVGLAGIAHETAVATVVAIGAVGLIIYAFVFDRLESFGPNGLRLRELKARAVQHFETGASDTLTFDDSADAIVTRGAQGQAAAAIRAATTPEQLIDTLVELIERPETHADQMARVRRDDEERAIRRRAGPSPTDAGAR